MAKVSPLQSDFSGGEISPLVYGRVDSERYATALATCFNYIPVIQGGLVRRSGTYWTAQAKATTGVRLIPFEFSTTQAYILEFTDLYIRFYRNNGQIDSGGSPYQIASPYALAHLETLKFTQSADVLYITHPSYAPRKLTRTAHTSWTLTEIDFQDGPYLTQNVGATTMAPSATTGNITVTASVATFAATDVGRLIRIKHSATWGWAKITAYTSTTVVDATVYSAFGNTTAVTIWRLGVWSATTGYPSCVTFHEDRLFFAGSTGSPQRVDGSNSSDYENFAPSATDGTVSSSNAVGFTLNSNDVNVIRWMSPDEKGLLIGTVGGEWNVRAASSSDALSPTNITAKKASAYGSADVQPVQVGKAALFVQRAGRKLRDMQYYYDVDGFRAADLTLLAEHITESGIIQLAFQKEPQQLLWALRDDGVLLGMTYERDDQSLKVGWHRHEIGGVTGGTSTVGSDIAKVKSIAVIPSADGTRDELWLAVDRTINGTAVTHVEYMTKIFQGTDAQKDAFFVDGGLSYDSPLTIVSITKANPAVATVTSHGFSNGDKVNFSSIEGMTEVNDLNFIIGNVAANTFELYETDGATAINSTAFETYVTSSGECRKMVTTVSGLTHLIGETVDILADGATHPTKVVSGGGSITLDRLSAIVHIGLGYNSDGQMLRLNAGSQDGTALGKTRRTHRVAFYLYRTLGFKYGTSFDTLDEITFRRSSDSMSAAVDLYTGILSENLPANYDFENQICWRQDKPLPGTILSVAPQMVTQDRG